MTLTFESIYELAIEAASARVNDLSSRRRTRDSAILKAWHDQATAEMADLCRGYNLLITDKYKELFKDGQSS